MLAFVPLCTVLNIYRSLIFPYMSYGLAAWDRAAKTHLQKRLLLQKRVLRLMYFSEPSAHAVSLIITSNILAINLTTSYACLFRLITVISLLKLMKYIRTRSRAPLQATFILNLRV